MSKVLLLFLIYPASNNKRLHGLTGFVAILYYYYNKGHLISECHFGIFNSPKKLTKKIDFSTMVPRVSQTIGINIQTGKLMLATGFSG